MDSNKGLLVPINYMGQWRKCDDGCWMYDALFTRYVRVRETTTYPELVDMICSETEISRDDNIIEVRGWMSYPVKEVMPPFIMMKDIDISTFIELNAKRDFVVPLCITTSPKPKVHTAPQQKLHVVMSPVKHPVSTSVNQPERIPYLGLEDIKLTNPVVCLKVDDDDFHEKEENSSNNEVDDDDNSVRRDPFDYEDDEEVDDGYVCRDPFDYEADKEVDDGYVRRDLSEFAIDFDSYFRVYLKSHPPALVNPQENQGSTPPKAENPTCAEYFSFPPSDIQENSPPAHSNTPMHIGNKRGRGRPRGKTAPSDAQSTNVHVLQDFRVGEILKSKAEMILRTRVMSIKTNREFKVTHSDRNRIIVVCVDKTCKWRMRGTFSICHGGWVIRSYEKQHSCSIDSREKRIRGVGTAETIAHMVKHDENDPVHLRHMLERVYGMKISYWKAWKAKEIANELIRGNPESSFLGLPSYLWLLEKANPGTYSAYQVDGNNYFEECFLAFGHSVAGFRSCIRPVIAVDACFLKGRYRGKLFIATAMDGNNQIYPLAFGVAATENDHTWSWFFMKLHHVVGARDDLVFISDRHPSIEKSCLQEFPDAVYGICMFHLGLNMAARYKVKAKDFLYGVAKAYTEIDFEERIYQVRSTKKEVYDYLIDADPSKWARCFFPARRYSIMTTNIAESMNALLKDAREFPIIGMLEAIRTKLQEWIHDRLHVANQCTSTLTPYAERKLGKRDDKSRNFKVHPIDQWRFYILDGSRDATVDIKLQTCTCNKFQLNQLPCSHAIRACRERGLSVYSVASRLYTIECLRLAYSILMNPVPHRIDWGRLVPDSIQSIVVRPPVVGNKKGRRKNKRIASQGEEVVRKQCGRCREWGHNKKTCTGNTYVPVGKHDKA